MELTINRIIDQYVLEPWFSACTMYQAYLGEPVASHEIVNNMIYVYGDHFFYIFNYMA